MKESSIYLIATIRLDTNMKNTSKNRVLILGTLFISFILLVGYYTIRERKDIVDPEPNIETTLLQFSEKEHFQTSDFQVTIEASEGYSLQGMDIYYTLDGTDPTLDSTLYTTPIPFSVTDTSNIYILKAAAAYQGKISSVTTQTYFCSSSIYDRYDLPVISITIPDDELYNEVTGIFMHTDKRSEAWVRSAHVEIINADGSTIAEQNIGLSVAGASSAGYHIIPLKIDAGKQWDVENKLPNIPDLFKSDSVIFKPSYQCLEKLPSLRLKNGGSFDYYKSMVREATCYSLAKDCGLNPLTDMYPAVVYLNGQYYDVMQMCATYSITNLADIYQLDSEQIQLIKGKEQDIATTLANKSYLLTADYNNSSVIEDFETSFDVDNFLQYYAFEILTDNRDWPNKNVAAWYYSGTPNSENVYTDGKIRFLYYDGSATYRMLTADEELFDNLFDTPADDVCWLSHVLQNEDYKRRFVNIICDMMSTSLSPKHVHSVIDKESSYLQTETTYLSNSDVEELNELFKQREASVDTFHDKIDESFWTVWVGMREYLNADYFNEEATYTLSIDSCKEGVTIQCNSLFIYPDEENFEGTYFTNFPALIQAVPHDGYVFDGWIVNGQPITDSYFYVMPEMIADHSVHIEAMYHPVEGSAPIINKLSAKDVEDWIELYNPYTNDIYLGNFYLSDNAEQLLRYQLPKITLHAGESVRIYGKNGMHLGSYKMNMNLKCGENLYLSDFNQQIIDSVNIPTMLDTNIYMRYKNGEQWCIFTIEKE